MPQPTFCLFCLGPLTNGAAVCSDRCDEGWWQICPTISGELYEPDEPEPEEPFYERDDIYITRPALELPPQPYEAAPLADREFIAGTRLRQHLILCGV